MIFYMLQSKKFNFMFSLTLHKLDSLLNRPAMVANYQTINDVVSSVVIQNLQVPCDTQRFI